MGVPHILIAGGGVIGLAIALELRSRQPACLVSVVDRPAMAGVASRAAAGMLAPYSEFRCDSPLFRLCRASLEAYPAFLGRFAPQVAFEVSESLLLDRPGHPHALGEVAAFLAGVGVECRHVATEAVRALEPNLAPEFTEGILLPEAAIDPRRLHEALAATARAAGVRFLSLALTGIERSPDGRIAGARFDDGSSIELSALVLATGAWSRMLGDLLGVALDVRPIKGQLLRLEAHVGTIRRTLTAPGIYLTPRASGEVVCGATVEDVGFAPGTDTAAGLDLSLKAAEAVPCLAGAPVNEAWFGFRPRTADGLPVLGRSSKVENLFLATGHYRNGILLVPETGRLLADSILSQAEPVAECFRPGRFGL